MFASGESSSSASPGPSSYDAPGPSSSYDAPGPSSSYAVPGPSSSNAAPGPSSFYAASGPSSSSPEEEQDVCPICLGVPQIRASPRGCRHVYCRLCLLKWKQVEKPSRCPMCKMIFKTVQSPKRLDGPHYPASRRDLLIAPFKLKQALVYQFKDDDFVFSKDQLWHARRKAVYRKNIYDGSKYVLPASIVGREATNKILSDRLEHEADVLMDLKRWIHRELRVLFDKKVPLRMVDIFIEILKKVHPLCLPLEAQLTSIFGDKTSHFIHELYHYMKSPFNIIEYDTYAAFGPLEIVSTLKGTVDYARAVLPRDLVEANHLKDFIQDELCFNKFEKCLSDYETRKAKIRSPSSSSERDYFVVCLVDSAKDFSGKKKKTTDQEM